MMISFSDRKINKIQAVDKKILYPFRVIGPCNRLSNVQLLSPGGIISDLSIKIRHLYNIFASL